MCGAYIHCRIDSMASQFPDVYAESASAILDFCMVRSGLTLIKNSEHTQNRNLDGNGEAL